MSGAAAILDAPEVAAADVGLEAPVSLDSPKLPALPLAALPGWLGAMVEAVATATETPPELAALLGLAAVGAACQKTFTVRPEPGYFEPVNLWAVAALPSGNRKSAVLNAMTRPLVEWEEERADAVAPDLLAAESRRKTLEARIAHVRGEAARERDRIKAEALAREVADLETQLPTCRSHRRRGFKT